MIDGIRRYDSHNLATSVTCDPSAAGTNKMTHSITVWGQGDNECLNWEIIIIILLSLYQPDHTQARPGWVAQGSQLAAYLMPPQWLGGGRRVTLSLSPRRYWEQT